MNLQNFLNSYNLTSDQQYEDAITICVFQKSQEEMIHYLQDLLEKVQKINHFEKRKHLNEALYRLLTNIQQNPNYTENSLYLVSSQIMDSFPLTKEHCKMYQDFKIPNPYYKTGSRFEIDFFRDYFLNTSFYIFFNIQSNSSIIIKQFTKSKEIIYKKDYKSIKDLDLLVTEYKKQTTYPIYYFTTSKQWTPPSNKDCFLVPQCFSSRDDFFEYLSQQEQLQYHDLLNHRLQDLQNSKTNLNIYVFGKLKKDIVYHIENYSLKELFIDHTKWTKLQNLLDKSYFNFKIYPIPSLQKDDIGDLFLNQYNGLMGIKYF